MTDAEQLPELLATQAQAVVDRAKSLGLTWTLRPATVVDADTGPAVIFDGDTATVGVVPLTGNAVPDDRVMVLQVPPGGNFIIGRLAGPFTPKTTLTFRGEQLATTDTTLTTASQVFIPALTLNLSSAAQYVVHLMVDFDAFIAGGNNLCAADLRIDGLGEPRQIIFQQNTSGVREVLSKTYTGNLSAGSHSIDAIAAKSLNTGGWAVRAVNTSFIYEIYQ